MEYKRIENNGYVIHFINNNRFKTVSVEIDFTSKLVEEEISYNKFLTRLLVYSNKKYNTRKKMSTYLEDRYGSSLFASSSPFGNLSNFTIGIDFINPKYTEEDEWNKNLDLLFDSLYNPNIEGDKFDSKSFDLIKDALLTNFRIREEYPSNIAYRRFETLMFDNSVASYDLLGKSEVIEKIDEKKMYDYYKKLFKDKCVNVIIHGNIDLEHEELIINYIKKNLINIECVSHEKLSPIIKRKLNNKKRVVEEKKNALESNLIMGFNIDNLDKEKYKYALAMYNSILGASSNSILFMEVREKKSFCYHIRSTYYKYSDALVISSAINKNNYKEAVKTVLKCIDMMNDKNVILDNLDKVKKEMNTSLNSAYDSQGAFVDYYYTKEFDDVDDIETKREKYNNVSVEDILEINKHIKISLIYFLEGTKENGNA